MIITIIVVVMVVVVVAAVIVLLADPLLREHGPCFTGYCSGNLACHHLHWS